MTDSGEPNFASRLRELRVQAGITQTELAERAGMHKFGIVKLERGDREPAWSTLLALAKALDVELSSFAEPPTSQQQTPRRGRPPKPVDVETSLPRRTGSKQKASQAAVDR